MAELHHHSERYREAAKRWVKLKAAADLLESSKSAFFSQMFLTQDAGTIAEREHNVRVSHEWREYITEMNEARENANLARVKVNWIEMQWAEVQSANATARSERRM